MEITLKAARVNMGLSQQDAARKIGISTDTLKHYECGKTYPDVPIIKKIESVYGVQYADIIFCPCITLKE